MRFHRIWFWVLAAAAIAGASAHAKAAEELRMYLDADYDVLDGEAPGLSLRPMLRTEQRFRDQGLVLLKVFAGARADLFPWLRLQSYYAHKDKFYTGHDEEHMAVLDVILHHDLGPVRISDRNGNEWHSQPGFYRYRNQLSLSASPGLSWLRLFIADEVRFDSDQARMNLNDIRAGVNVRAGRYVKFSAFYDLESNRRSSQTWHKTDVLGLMCVVRL